MYAVDFPSVGPPPRLRTGSRVRLSKTEGTAGTLLPQQATRLVQVLIPEGNRVSVVDALDEQGFDSGLFDEASRGDFEAMAQFPVPPSRDASEMDELVDDGGRGDSQTIAVPAETVISQRRRAGRAVLRTSTIAGGAVPAGDGPRAGQLNVLSVPAPEQTRFDDRILARLRGDSHRPDGRRAAQGPAISAPGLDSASAGAGGYLDLSGGVGESGIAGVRLACERHAAIDLVERTRIDV